MLLDNAATDEQAQPHAHEAPVVDIAGGFVAIDTAAAGLGEDPDEAEARAATDDGS